MTEHVHDVYDPEEWDADEIHGRLDKTGHEIRALAGRVTELVLAAPPRDPVDEALLAVLAADLLVALQAEKRLRALLKIAVEG